MLAPWKKSYDQPRKTIRKRKYYFTTKVHVVKGMVFSVVIYGCKRWTIKEAEHWTIDAFKLWWRRLLRTPWTARRSNQSILEEISPEYSLEGLMLKPKLQYFGHLMWRTYSFVKTLMLGKIEGGRRRRWQRMILLDVIINSKDMSLSKFRELMMDKEAWLATIHEVTKSRTWLSVWNDWLKITWTILSIWCHIISLTLSTILFFAFSYIVILVSLIFHRN